MSHNDASQAPILVAMPDEWAKLVRPFLEKEGYSVLAACSREEALSLVQSRSLRAVVIISDWAMTSDDSKAIGLMEIVKGKIPTVSLITGKTWSQVRYRWVDELYHRPIHEFCTTPFAAEEILARLAETIRAAEGEGSQNS